MRKILLAIIIPLVFLFGCNKTIEPTNNETPPIEKEVIEENLNIPPFKDRKYIYLNDLNIESYEEDSIIDEKTRIYKYYKQISGLINEDIQNKINETIINTLDETIVTVKDEIIEKTENSFESFDISCNSSIPYSCNNVIFVKHLVIFNYKYNNAYEYKSLTKTYGFDLNTGNILELKDLFVTNFDYEKFINEYINLHLIKRGFDDPNSSVLDKPFQGIRENQTFSFDTDGVHIYINEQNDEFVYQRATYDDNWLVFTVPIKEIGEYLAIFDRYYDNEKNIFTTNNKYKKLLPNQVEVVYDDDYILKYEQYYDVEVANKHFINLNNQELENKIKELSESTYDVDKFIEDAEKHLLNNPGTYYGQLDHSVHVPMNSGGYLSVFIRDYVYVNNEYKFTEHFLNYDLSNNKYMKLGDLFVDGFDYKNMILSYVYNQPNVTRETISEEDFYISQDGIYVIYLEGYSNWISLESIGLENIAFLQ